MSESNNPFPMPHWPQQSPINLSKSESVYVKYPKTVFKFDYSGAPFQGKFIGEDRHKNFELLSIPAGQAKPTIQFDGVKAELIKIHLHTGAEHGLDGVDLGGEIHLIHKIEEPTHGSEFLVLGVFFVPAEKPIKTSFFSDWLSGISTTAHKQDDEPVVSLDPRNLMPKTGKWYRYEGSLTSKPYNEVVSWLVFVDPLGISSSDLTKLKRKAHQPERPIQPLSRRFVIRNFQ